MKSDNWKLRGGLSRTTMTLCTCTLKNNFALLFESIQRRIWIRQWGRACFNGIGERFNPIIREEHALE